MAVADTKKVQTMVNVAAEQLEIIRSALDALQAVKTAYQTENPSVAGTVLAGGNAALMNTALGTLQTAADDAIWDTLIESKVPTHKNKALG